MNLKAIRYLCIYFIFTFTFPFSIMGGKVVSYFDFSNSIILFYDLTLYNFFTNYFKFIKYLDNLLKKNIL